VRDGQMVSDEACEHMTTPVIPTLPKAFHTTMHHNKEIKPTPKGRL